jgi:hypothetical protein
MTDKAESVVVVVVVVVINKETQVFLKHFTRLHKTNV